ncbi:MAG: RNA polymerase sigma factor [Acidobacteria bacterium]|nr:RNA polymerase sigma factor [Acidobacteriota bacterium]
MPRSPEVQWRTDVEWATRVAAGDGTAFEQLYQQHAGRLYNLASRMAATPADADDLLQEIFLQVYRKAGSFRGDSSLGTWLYRLAMNHCLDVVRSRQARMAHVTDSMDEPDASPVAAPGPALGAVNRLDLERAIAALPPACRAAFLLHDVEGFGHQEVATILGISEGTSKSQVHKARLRIRAHLGTR